MSFVLSSSNITIPFLIFIIPGGQATRNLRHIVYISVPIFSITCTIACTLSSHTPENSLIILVVGWASTIGDNYFMVWDCWYWMKLGIPDPFKGADNCNCTTRKWAWLCHSSFVCFIMFLSHVFCFYVTFFFMDKNTESSQYLTSWFRSYA